MNLTQEFISSIREDLDQKEALWNPSLLMDDDWEFNIPLDAGVAIKIHCHTANEHYKLDSFVKTVGGSDPEYALIRQVLEETIETHLPVCDVHYMTDLGGVSTSFTIPFDSLEGATTQVEVDLPWGDDPIVVNVPDSIEDKADYAETTVDRLVRKDLRTAVSAVSTDPVDVTPVARE